MIIFCCSNLTLPSTLTLLGENKEKDFLVITTNYSIYRVLIDIIDKHSVLYFVLPPVGLPGSLKNVLSRPFYWLKAIYDNLRHKRKFKTEIKKRIIRKHIVYFELYVFCDFEFWMVATLKRISEKFIFLKNLKDVKTEPLRSIDRKVYAVLNSLVFHTKLEPCLASGMSSLKLTEAYLNDLGAKTIEGHVNTEIINKLVADKFPDQVKSKDFVVLTGGRVSGMFVKENSYLKLQDQILTIIEEVGSKEKVVVKSHPVYEEYIGLEKEFERIPAYLPFNIFSYDPYKFIIGVTSTVLIEASHNSKCRIISTLNLFKGSYVDEKFHEELLYYLKTNMSQSNPILFPNSLSEFKALIELA